MNIHIRTWHVVAALMLMGGLALAAEVNVFNTPIVAKGGVNIRGGTLSTVADAGLGGNLTVNGATVCKGTLASQGALSTTLGATVGTNLTVTMDAGVSGNLTVDGNTIAKGTLTSEGAATLASLSVTGADTALTYKASSSKNFGAVLLGDAGTGIPTATVTVTTGSHCACSNTTWEVAPKAVTCSVSSTTLTIRAAPGAETTATYVCL